MDAKLKALKVVDLKQILSKAQVSAPAKATKNDLIAKIQANKSALDVYAQLYPQDDLLAPPEEVDWNVDQLDATPPPQKQQKTSAVLPAPAPPAPEPKSTPEPVATVITPAKPTAAASPAPTSADEELEKRRQRAARFGIPLVEPQQKKQRPVPAVATAKAVAASIDPKVLEQRATRFGLEKTKSTEPATVASTNGKKRPAPQSQEVDPEEMARRQKRAERFGLTNKA